MRATSTFKKSFKSKESFKKSLITTAVAAAVALSSGFASAASDLPTLTEPVKAGNWSASLNRTEGGNYDINVFDQLVTGAGKRTLNVEKSFSQTDFEAVKALDGFGEFGNYYDDDDINPYQVGMVDGVFINGADTDVTFNNASVVVTGGTLDGNPYVEIGGVYHREGAAGYTGASTNIHVSSAAAVDADEEAWVYGYALDNPLGFAETQRRVTFSADKTDIAAESTNENGLDVIAFAVSTDAVDNPAVTFARGETTITASTANDDMWAYALYMHNSDNNDGSGSVTVAEGATLKLVATGGNPTGLYIDHGTFTSNGTLIVRATTDSQVGSPSGIVAAGNAELTFNGKTEVYTQGDYGEALFVNSDYAGTVAASATFGSKSETTLNGSVAVGMNCPVKLDGTMTVNGFVELIGSLTGSGNLTINGQRAEQEDKIGSIFHYGSEVALNSLAITNADVMNQSNISVDGTITLNDVLFENAEGDPRYDWPDAELQAAELVIGNAEFNNYGEVDVSGTVTLNEGAVVTNYKGFHSPSMVLNAGSRFTETYDLDDPEDAAEFNSGVIAIDGDLMQFSGGTLEAQSKDGQSMEITGIKLLPDPGSGPDDSMIRFTAGDYSFDTFEVDAPEFGLGPRLQVEGGTLTLGTLKLTEGDALITGGTVNAGTLSVEGGSLIVGSGFGTALLSVADRLSNATDTDITVANNGTLATNIGAVGFKVTDSGYELDDTVHSVAVEAGGTMRVEGFDGISLSIDQLAKLKKDLAGEDAQGLLELVGDIEITDLDVTDNEVTADQVKDLGNVTTSALKEATVTEVSDDGISGSFKNVELAANVDSLAVTETSGALTLNGSSEGGSLVASADAEPAGIVVNKQVATIGDASQANKGEVTSITFKANATVNVVGTNDAVFDLGTVTTAENGSGALNVLGAKAQADEIGGAVDVNIGSSDAAGHVHVTKLSTSGLIFLDPVWKGNDEISGGSFLTVSDVGSDGKLNAQIVVGRNSTLAIGATKEQTVEAFAETALDYGRNDVTAVFYAKKAVSLSDTGAIYVNGSLPEAPTSVQAGSFNVAANGLFMADAAAAAQGAVVTASTVKFEEGAHIRVVGLSDETMSGTLMSATSTDQNAILIDQTVLDDAAQNSGIYSLDIGIAGGNVTYVATEVAAADAFPNFKGTAFLEALREVGLDENAADRTQAFLSRLNYHYGMTADEASDIGNQAMALAATAGVYNVALDASKLMNRSVDGRMSIANGLVRGEGATVWADVLATTNEAKSLYGDSGYDVDLYGGVLGADVGLGNGKVIGAALTVGTGDGGSKGAAFDVDNDADFVGFSVYGSHRLGDFNGKVDIGWMHTTSDLSATAFGVKLDDEVTADAWTVGIGGEYLFNVGSINIVPHVGIRWTRLDVDGYTGAFKTDDDTMDVFTAPIGVAFSGNVDAGGWKLAPKVDLSIVPSFGDDEATSKVRWGSVKETIKTQVVDDAPFQASLGIDAQNGDWTVGAAYELGIGGDDRLDNAFTLRARYVW